MLKLLSATAMLAVATGSAMAATLTLGGVDLGKDKSGTFQGTSTSQSGTILEDFSGNKVHSVHISGAIGLASNSLAGVRLEPKNDTSGYLYLRTQNGSGDINIVVPRGQRIDYLGFYIGSVDPYDFFSFVDANNVAIPISFGATAPKTTISGTDIAVTAGGHTPDDLLNSSTIPSLYVNIAFSPGEQVSSIHLNQSDFGIELDNLTYRYAPNAAVIASRVRGPAALAVDAPGGTALAGLGLGALAFDRRRRSRSA